MSWSDDYVGIPWIAHGSDRDGSDCWGLVRLVYREMRGVVLDSFADGYVTAQESDEIQRIIDGEKASGPWRAVNQGEERPFDVALFRIVGRVSHVGLVVEPGLVIHAQRGADSAIIRYGGIKWSGRVAGFQRFAGHEREGGE